MYKYKKNEKKKFKKYIKSLFAISIISFFSISIYKMYNDINIENFGQEQGTRATKISQTVKKEKEDSKNISEVIEKVSSSVVGISKIKNNGSSVFLKNGTEELGLGTGMIVSENGYILTNEHVSGSKYSTCYVTLENGKTYNGDVVWSDKDIDLSIVKISMKGLNYIKLGNSEEIRVGQTVYAIGNPIGFEFQRTVTSGIISATNRTIKIEEKESTTYMSNLIQTDATINPGNSGGPLISIDGDVIAINSVKITSAEGIGFAIPVNIVKPIINQYIEYGNFEEANIGIFAYDKDIVKYLNENNKIKTGIYVEQVNLNGPAYKAGIKEKDIIIKIDDIELNKMGDLREYIYTKKPNEEVKLTILRNKREIQIKIKLGKK